MILVQIRFRHTAHDVRPKILLALEENLPSVVAEAFTLSDVTKTSPDEVDIESEEGGPFDVSRKDVSVRIWAYDYHECRGYGFTSLEAIRRKIAREVCKHLPEDISWNVMVMIVPMSYGSDTVD